MVHVTRSALDSYCEFYPEASEDDVLDALDEGVQMETPIALRLAGRRVERADHRGAFIMHVERTGMFVVVDDKVVTFVLFRSLNQHETALRLYPGGKEPTARAIWAKSGPLRTPSDIPSSQERGEASPVLGCLLRELRIPADVVARLYGDVPKDEKIKCRWQIRNRIHKGLLNGNHEKTVDDLGREMYRVGMSFREGISTKLAVYHPWKLDEWWVAVGDPPKVKPEHAKMADELRAAGWHVSPPHSGSTE